MGSDGLSLDDIAARLTLRAAASETTDDRDRRQGQAVSEVTEDREGSLL